MTFLCFSDDFCGFPCLSTLFMDQEGRGTGGQKTDSKGDGLGWVFRRPFPRPHTSTDVMSHNVFSSQTLLRPFTGRTFGVGRNEVSCRGSRFDWFELNRFGWNQGPNNRISKFKGRSLHYRGRTKSVKETFESIPVPCPSHSLDNPQGGRDWRRLYFNIVYVKEWITGPLTRNKSRMRRLFLWLRVVLSY